jgi:uncharacterized protein with NAD-binding domain and iron-sulfur cluster
MTKRIAILGGGIGGLSAAHHLIKLGFQVDVYERDREIGGKARSQLVKDPRDPKKVLPGEHGFRFYPHFYRHLFETMKQIPFTRARAAATGRSPSTDGSVYGNLTESAEAGVADGRIMVGPRVFEKGPDELIRSIGGLFQGLDVSARDLATYAFHLVKFLTSSKERREGEYEWMTWSEYIGRERNYSPAFARLLAAIPRTMVAMSADVGSARTIGNISTQLLFVFENSAGRMDATMTGPTTDVWLAPWREHLAELGVRFNFERSLARFDFEGGRITRAIVEAPCGRKHWAEADYYVSAVPLEVMQRKISRPMEEFDHSLHRMRRMENATAWMAGAQFFLRRDVRLCRGHLFYPGSDWGLTSISQAQFWEPRMGPVKERFGAGDLDGIISVDIGDWETPSRRIGKSAKECSSREEVLDEVWHQLKSGIGGEIRDDDLIHRHLDENIAFERDASGRVRPGNRTPLLIHRPGQWFDRPDAELRIPNLVLAADYVRTFTDLASMEAANEAARRAVRAILRREDRDPELCPIWALTESKALERAQQIDRLLYLNGRRKHAMDAPGTLARFLRPAA